MIATALLFNHVFARACVYRFLTGAALIARATLNDFAVRWPTTSRRQQPTLPGATVVRPAESQQPRHTIRPTMR